MCCWPSRISHRGRVGRLSRGERVAGLVDGGGDLRTVDRSPGRDGDLAGGDVDGNRLDTVDAGNLLCDGALAVRAGHAGDGERDRAGERVGRAGQHGNSFADWWWGRDQGSLGGWLAPAKSPGLLSSRCEKGRWLSASGFGGRPSRAANSST